MSRRWLLGLLLPLALAGCSSSGKASTPSAAVTTPPTERTTTTLSVEEQVKAAYLKSWDVYAKAVRTLDSSGLEESYVGRALEIVRSEIQRRTSERRPSRVSVEHHISIEIVDAARAVAVDRYLNHSVRLDPDTGAPAEPDPNETIAESYSLTLVGGTWKVSGIVRQ